jgi:uncharacterized protein (TIGR03067 family)
MNLTCSFAILAALVAAHAPAPDRPTDPAKAIQGDWIVQSLTIDNKPGTDLAGHKVKITASKFESQPPEPEYNYKLGTAGKSATIDFTSDGGALLGKTLHGIFKIEGDTLTICTALEPEQERPATIDNKEGKRLLVLKREKK